MSARAEIERIRMRQRILGDCLRGDPAWEILLDLADAGSLKTSAVGGSTRVPPTTTLRYLAQFENEGLIERVGGHSDARLSLVSLTQAGREAVDRCLA